MHVLRHQWSEARRPFAKKYVDTLRDMMRDHREQSSSAASNRRRQKKHPHGSDQGDDDEMAAVGAEWMSFALSGALPAGSPLLSFVAEYVQPQPLARARAAIDQVCALSERSNIISQLPSFMCSQQTFESSIRDTFSLF
jgi:hypothetical protein